MSTFDSMKTLAVKTFGKTAVRLQEHSPQILTALGVAGVLTSGVLLVRQTLSVQPILEEHKDELDAVKSAPITPDYSEQNQNKDIARVYTRTAGGLVKHYGPTVAVGVSGLACLLVSHGIMRQRNVALVAAYQTIEKSYSQYRKRVAEQIGEEKEQDIYRGFKKESIVDEETGKKKTVTTVDPNGISLYARFFDESSKYWNKTPEYNLIFLRQKQSYFNDMLQATGKVFLNDVYKELGLPLSQAGQTVGWDLASDSDGYIDFGMYDMSSEAARAFVNGFERSIRMDFNVSGVILGAIHDTI